MRVLVCGGRDYADRAHVFATLDALHRKHGISLLIHGAATGADSIADAWTHDRGVDVLAFPAQWREHGKGAGPIRNAQMLTEGRPDVVVAFPGGSGTEDMVRKAEAAGVRVWRVGT